MAGWNFAFTLALSNHLQGFKVQSRFLLRACNVTENQFLLVDLANASINLSEAARTYTARTWEAEANRMSGVQVSSRPVWASVRGCLLSQIKIKKKKKVFKSVKPTANDTLNPRPL